MYLEERIEQLESLVKNLSEEVEYLKSTNAEEVLTPQEFAEFFKVTENTVYCWIREGKIEILQNVGKAKRIPISQFYKKKPSLDLDNSERKPYKKAEQLRREFLAIKKFGR